MNAVKDILNSIRSKMKPRVIISLSLICVLIFPAILIENSSIPTSDSNMYLLSCPNGVRDTFIGFSNLSSSTPQTYYLLNNKLDPGVNLSLKLNVSVQAQNLIVKNYSSFNIYFAKKTGNQGNFTLNNSYIKSLSPKVYDNKEYSILAYCVENYSVLNSKGYQLANQKDEKFDFSVDQIINTKNKSKTSNMYIAYLPSYLLGYYGLSPVILVQGPKGGIYNLSYHLYNPQQNNSVGAMVYLGNYSYNKIYTFNSNEQMVLSMNEAYNVTFFINGTSMNTNFRSSIFSSSLTVISLLGLLGNTGSEIMLLVTVFMVLMLFVPMFNPSVYKYYLSLPRKRWHTVMIEFTSSIITMSIFEGFAFLATYVISEAVLKYSLSGLVFLYIYLFSLAAYTVFASIYLLVGAYFIGRSAPKTFLTLFLVLGYPIIYSFLQTILEIGSLSPFYTGNSLFKPVLDNIRTQNVITGILPVLNVEELNSYFLRSPTSGVVMLNHLSIFDLSPIIFLSSIVGISVALFYLSIRRYYRY
ncbi:multipass membrane protein [Cuniculiplasma divulgatum]|uniref:Multipass membrane protein n=1 Tax=Cuniculiplasma divulgatum TaxID=1673428 RepID=A0A1R4A4X6_9ARCH|nr:multipass membrane protein [Cuniculiplasma divulgatum]